MNSVGTNEIWEDEDGGLTRYQILEAETDHP